MTKLDDARLSEVLAGELEKNGFHSMADSYLLQGVPFEDHFAWKVALSAMSRIRDEALKEAAEVCDAMDKKDILGRYDPEDCACAILSLIPQPKEEGK